MQYIIMWVSGQAEPTLITTLMPDLSILDQVVILLS